MLSAQMLQMGTITISPGTGTDHHHQHGQPEDPRHRHRAQVVRVDGREIILDGQGQEMVRQLPVPHLEIGHGALHQSWNAGGQGAADQL